MGKFTTGEGQSPGSSWPIFLAVAVTLTLLAEPLRGLFDGVSELAHFHDRAIGQTTFEGLDASGYAENYIRLQTLLAALVFGLYFLLSPLRRWLDSAISPDLAAEEHRWIARLSEIWIALAILELFLRDEFLATLQSFCGHAIGLVLAVLMARIWFTRRRDTIMLDLLGDRHLLTATLFVPLSLIFAFWVMTGRPISFTGRPVSVWFLVVVVLWIGLLALHRLAIRQHLSGTPKPAEIRTRGARLAVAGVPLILIPASLPLVNELQYRLPTFAPESLARGVIFALGLASLALYLASRRRPWLSTATLLHNVYYPVFLATCALFKTHHHQRFFGELDYFHLGEETVPTQQWLEFGSVPMIDLRLAHTFSDMFYQGLYSLVHGYRGLDMLTWIAWMPEVLAVLLIYFVIARVVSPGFSCLVVALIPIMGAVSEYYSVVFLPALFLYHALTRPTWARFAAMWASFLGLTLWRIDFGMIGAVALALVLGVYLLRSPARRWRAVFFGLAAVAAAAIIAFILFMLWSDRPAFAALVSLLKSYSYRLITRTRSDIISEYNLLAVLQYYLLPAVSLVYIVYYGVKKLLHRGYLERYKYLLVFLAIFSLVLSVRSLERHSLIEAFNPYYFVFLLAFLPFLLRPTGTARESHASRLLCLGVLLANALLLMPVSLFGAGRHQMLHLFKEDAMFAFRPWRADEQRVIFHRENHHALVEFIESELSGDQTFFDFTNSPLLYVLAGKRFPTYVIPNLVQTSEPIQNGVVKDLTTLDDAGLLPYVIFKQGHDFWDQTDGVPNEVRSYRIAELIYQRYEPLARFGRYEVWCRKDIADVRRTALAGGEGTIQPISPQDIDQRFDLKRLPYVWGQYDPLAASSRTAVLAVLQRDPVRLDRGEKLALTFDPAIDKTNGNYLHLRLWQAWPADRTDAGNQEVSITVSYGEQFENSFAFELAALPQGSTGAWALEKTESPVMHDMKTFRIGERLVFEATGENPRANQAFDLSHLSETPIGVQAPGTTAEELYLRLRYRAATAGRLQVFYSFDGQAFRDNLSRSFDFVETSHHGEPAVAVTPVSLPAETARRLTDIRFEIPEDSIFEVVSAEILRRPVGYEDYLIRLSSQWKWTSEPISKLILHASGPVEVGEVLLRGGD